MLRALALSLLLSSGAVAQDAGVLEPAAPDADRTLVWGGVGVGPATQGLGAGYHVTAMRGPHALSVRLLGAVEVPPCSFLCGESESVADLGVLYGREVFASDAVLVLASGGLAYVETTGVEGALQRTVGVPVEFRAMVRGPYAALHATAFANANGERPFGGVVFGLSVGRTR